MVHLRREYEFVSEGNKLDPDDPRRNLRWLIGLHSLEKALVLAGARVSIEPDAQRCLDTDTLVLPGVGAFGHAATRLAAVVRRGPPEAPGDSLKNISTRPFGAQVGPSLWKPSVRILSPEPSGFIT